MTTVEDVAEELGRPVVDVLEACAHLGIVASGASSGLSSDEHRRLRTRLGGDADLGEIPKGSHRNEPDPAPVPDLSSLRARHDELVRQNPPRRWDLRTATRVSIGLFLLVAVGVAVVTLSSRADQPQSALGFGTDDEGSCHDIDEGGGPLLTEVDCDDAHDVELYAVVGIDLEALGISPPGTEDRVPFPGTVALVEQAEERCGQRFVDYVGRPDEESALGIALLVPTPETWEADDRAILCLVEDPSGPLTESVRDTDR